MTEERNKNVGSGLPKKVSMILIILLIITGGGTLAFLFIGSSPKEDYFQAEIDTYKYFEEQVKNRFENELDWLEVTENNPVASNLEVSAQFNDPGFFGYGTMADIEEIVNNSTLSVSSESDFKNKQIVAQLDANVAGLDFSDFRFSLDENTLLVDLPFLDEVLKLEDQDIGPFLHMIDPFTFDDDIEIDFSELMDQAQSGFTEEDKEHFKETYGKLIYDELEKDNFSSEKETIEIEDESIKAEKIELSLTEEDVKHLLTVLLEEIQADDYFKDLIREQFEFNFLPADEIDQMMEEFDEDLELAIEEIDDIKLPNGITSTIWTDRGLIVKRSFAMTTIDSFDEEVSLEVEGTQLLEDHSQAIDYDIKVKDSFDDFTVNLSGDFIFENGEIDDQFTFDFQDIQLNYEASEVLEGSKRDFTRSIGYDDGWMHGALVWEGNSTHEADMMQGNHQLYLDIDEFNQDMFVLNIDIDEKQIKEVELIEEDGSLNIGTMSEEELIQFIEEDAQAQFMDWYFNLLGGMAEFLE